LHLQHGVGTGKFKADKLEGFGHTLDEFNRLARTKNLGNFKISF